MLKTKKEISFRKSFIRRSIVIAVAAVLLLVIILLSKIEALAEFMTRTVSRFLLMIAGNITSIFPFSILEFLLIVGVLVLLTGIVLFFVRLKKLGKKSFLGILDLTIVILCFVILYQFCVGFAYYRAPLDLSAEVKEMNDSFAASAASYFADDFSILANTLERDEKGCVIIPYTHKELNEKLRTEFERLDNGYLNPYTPKYKNVGLSSVMAELGIAGVFFGPLGEANITGYAQDFEKPFYAAHEIAHAKGIMRESEADLVAAYLLLTSDDPYLRYSGYMFTYDYHLLNPIYWSNNDLYMEFYTQIPQVVWEERAISYEIYYKYDHLNNYLSEVGNKVNDLYLKLNGQKDGTASYNDYGNTEITYPEPSEPGEPVGPPVYVHHYSLTEKILLSICPF